MSQQGDVRIFQTVDGGDISVAAGLVGMDGGLETAVYLSMFGGNFDDPGAADKRRSWWGNLGEANPTRQYRGATQYLLRSLPMTSGNLKRIEDAVRGDLAWLVSEKVASSLTIAVAIEGLNRLRIEVNVVADGVEAEFTFAANWKAGA